MHGIKRAYVLLARCDNKRSVAMPRHATRGHCDVGTTQLNHDCKAPEMHGIEQAYMLLAHCDNEHTVAMPRHLKDMAQKPHVSKRFQFQVQHM